MKKSKSPRIFRRLQFCQALQFQENMLESSRVRARTILISLSVSSKPLKSLIPISFLFQKVHYLWLLKFVLPLVCVSLHFFELFRQPVHLLAEAVESGRRSAQVALHFVDLRLVELQLLLQVRLTAHHHCYLEGKQNKSKMDKAYIVQVGTALVIWKETSTAKFYKLPATRR